MKSRLIIISFSLFFVSSAEAICVPRNKTTPSPSPDTPPNLRPVSIPLPFSAKAPTPSLLPSPLRSPRFPIPLSPAPKAPSPAAKAPSTILGTITSPLPRPGGGGNNPALQKICGGTDYPDVCSSTLGPVAGPASDVSAVLGVAIKAGSDFAKTAVDAAGKLASRPGLPPDDASPIKDCKDSYDDAVYNFQNAADALTKKDVGTMNTMLSAALTDVGDCQDAFEGQSSPLAAFSDTLKKMASNCLAIVDQMNK
ncbi:hypothetical protein DCAR_0832575 [Daucus carota subsp. sativus]|uniref:Uncharacterized protein n=1 Tax=Daucus carota subsp. sativus TaxID=79200 RepID=A0A175YR52_DAUCS|nr:PREDICTED: arabinogalactan protein 1-like [Daucus carota subsp. sativus]WOH13066.1 hypothetical protein DCAR_0832575 [Daucus carota subsp. sativus]